MRRCALLPLLPLLGAVPAAGQDLSGSYVFQSPQGPVTLEVQHAGTQVAGVMTGADGSVNRLDGTFDGQKATGTIVTPGGQAWFALGFLEGGLTLLVAEVSPMTGEPDLDNGWRLDFVRNAQVAADVAPGEQAPGPSSAESSPLVREWLAHLTGKKVTYMDSYTSSDVRGSAGFSDRWEAYLCSDGTFQYRSKSRMGVDVGGVWGGGSDRNAFTGSWRIIDQGGQAILQFQRSEQAGTEEGQWIALAYRNGETYFDGSRVYVTADNYLCT